MDLSKYLEECSATSVSHGFNLADRDRQLLLMHSEISEAVEGYRNNDEANFWEEMADLFIRWASFCGYNHSRIEAIIQAKMAVNVNRPHMHGGKAF
jgi:hypothetical protein